MGRSVWLDQTKLIPVRSESQQPLFGQSGFYGIDFRPLEPGVGPKPVLPTPPLGQAIVIPLPKPAFWADVLDRTGDQGIPIKCSAHWREDSREFGFVGRHAHGSMGSIWRARVLS